MKRNKRIYRPKFREGGDLGFNLADTNPAAQAMIGQGLDMVAPGAGSLYSGITSGINTVKAMNLNEYGQVGRLNKNGVHSDTGEAITSSIVSNLSATVNPMDRVGAIQKASENGGNMLESGLAFYSPQIAEDLATRKAMEKEKRVKAEDYNRYKTEVYKQDLADLSSYNTKGDYNTSFYAEDGALVPIAPGAFEAKGATHQQGGIDMGNVEIENKELVRPQPNGTMEIDSARLGTAKKNKELLEQKNQLLAKVESIKNLMGKEQKLNDLAKNEYSKNTVARNLEKLNIQAREFTTQIQAIDAEIESNFQEQQQVNGNYGYPSNVEMGQGDTVKKYGGGGTIDEDPNDPLSMLASSFNNTNNDKLPPQYDITGVYANTGGKPKDKSTLFEIGSMKGSSNEALGMVQNMYPDGSYPSAYTPGKDPNDYKSYTKTGKNTNPHNMSYADFWVDMQNNGITDAALIEKLGGKWGHPKSPNELYKLKQLILNPDGSYKSIEELNSTTTNSNDNGNSTDLATVESINPFTKPITEPGTLAPIDTTDSDTEVSSTNHDWLTKAGSIANRVVPYIDIVGNKILNDRLRNKEVPREDALIPANYNTDYNVNPQLAEISRATSDFNYNIGKNVSSPLAGAYQLASLKSKMTGTSSVLDKEQQYELAANAQKSRETNQITNANIQMNNARKQKVFEKDIQTDYVNPSKNLAKLESNLKDEITENRKEKYDNQTLAALQAAYPKQVIGSFVSMFNSTESGVVEQGMKNLNDSDKVKAGFSQIATSDNGWNKFVKHAESFNLTGDFVTADNRVAIFKNGKFQSFKK